MKRLEVLHLRLVGNRPETLIKKIRDAVVRHDPETTILLYQHAAVKTDLAVHIHIAEPSANHVDTELGVRLASALREFGMVEHTIWIEQKGDHGKCNC